jgi:hypothetical protein
VEFSSPLILREKADIVKPDQPRFRMGFIINFSNYILIAYIKTGKCSGGLGIRSTGEVSLCEVTKLLIPKNPTSARQSFMNSKINADNTHHR